jgi:hypothetical protein
MEQENRIDAIVSELQRLGVIAGLMTLTVGLSYVRLLLG